MAQAISTTGMLPTLDDELAPILAAYDHDIAELDDARRNLERLLVQIEDGDTTVPPSAVEASPAGAERERAVPCAVCATPTFNHSGRCDRHRKRCAICLTPIPFGNWCSKACFRADEGDDHDEDDR